MTIESKPTWSLDRNPQCKICCLPPDHIEVFDDMHHKVIVEGIPRYRIMNIANTYFAEKGLDIRFNSVNMGRHFDRHVIMNQLQAEPEVKKPAPAVPIVKDLIRNDLPLVPVPQPKQQVGLDRLGNDVDDYSNLDRLYSMLVSKMELIDKLIVRSSDDTGVFLGASDTPDGNGGQGPQIVSQDALETLLGFIKETRAVVMDINKVRRSSTIMLLAFQSLAEDFCMNTFNDMDGLHKSVEAACRANKMPEQQIAEVFETLKQDTLQAVIANSRAAVDKVVAKYKVK